MKRWMRFAVLSALGLGFASIAAADTLELRDGRVITGRFLGGTAAVVRFEVRGNVETYNVPSIVALTFTNDYGNGAAAAPAAAPAYASSAVPQGAATPDGMITVPAGQSMLVRMIDSVDSEKNHIGDIFHASLETDLFVNGTLVARKGTDIYGRLAEAQQAGHLSGSAELQLELTRMVINGRDYPLVSSDYTLQGKGRGKNTAEKVVGGAALGTIIGAIAGGGKGAAIGAGAGAGTGAAVNVLTRGQQIKVPSETLLEFRLQQPATVTPVQS